MFGNGYYAGTPYGGGGLGAAIIRIVRKAASRIIMATSNALGVASSSLRRVVMTGRSERAVARSSEARLVAKTSIQRGILGNVGNKEKLLAVKESKSVLRSSNGSTVMGTKGEKGVALTSEAREALGTDNEKIVL